MHNPLVTPQELAAAADVRIVDCRFDLANPSAGESAYAAGHIPGAVYAHLDRDLSSPRTPRTGRHPLPDVQALAAKLGAWGIDGQTPVVAYDADNGMFASRLWWLLRWLGHDAIAVLNGGFKAWVADGLPTTKVLAAPAAKTFVPRPRAEMVVDTDDVARLIARLDWRVLDARAPERFRGAVEPIDPVAGHIPGALNHPFATNIDADGRFVSAQQLAANYTKSLDGVGADHCIAMCGSGVTACHNLLAMEVAGLRGAKLYAGSWSEWITDPLRPVTK